MPTFTCQFYHFIGNRAKNILIFRKNGWETLHFSILKQFLHLQYHRQPHLNLPLFRVMDSYDRGV